MVEFKITKLESGFEAAHKAALAEIGQMAVGTGKLGLEETIKKARTKEVISTSDSYDRLEDTSGEVYRQVSAFTGTFSGLSKLLRQLRKNSEDISPLLKVLKDDFFSTNEKLIFSQYAEGALPGYKSVEPSSRYGQLKIKHKGSVWPVLVFSGNLKLSLTNEQHPDAIARVLPKSLRLGTRVEYAKIHQDGAGNTPPRPPVSFTVGGRFEKWKRYTLRFMQRTTKDTFK